LFPINKGAPIVHFHYIGWFRFFACPLFDDFVLQTVWQSGYSLLLCVLVQKLFALGLVLFRRGLHILLLLGQRFFLFLGQFLLERLQPLLQLVVTQGHGVITQDV